MTDAERELGLFWWNHLVSSVKRQDHASVYIIADYTVLTIESELERLRTYSNAEIEAAQMQEQSIYNDLKENGGLR